MTDKARDSLPGLFFCQMVTRITIDKRFGHGSVRSGAVDLRPTFRFLCVVLLLLIGSRDLQAADPLRSLTPIYRHWIEEEVPYIISTSERKTFLALHSDAERDGFINAFWDSRNPVRGGAYNAFKEEHYRRLSYVNEHFGSARYNDGWRTDMGRVYITLGAPQLTTPYHLTANIRQLEIWFYQAPSPVLPPFFNVLFFRPGPGEDYKIYSPRNDGPAKLTSTGQQDNLAALKVIRTQLGAEVAHIALSLIPSEPVDFDTGQPSMESDLLLNTLRNLADNPLEQERFARARPLESAVSSLIVPVPTDLQTTTYRDSRGRLTVSYLLRNHSPRPALIGKRKDGATGYSMALRTTLSTADGTRVYEQQSALEGALTGAQAEIARSWNFGAEDRLPIVPGEYSLEVSLRNNLTAEATVYRDRLTVSPVDAGQLGISPLEVYGQPSPVHDTAGNLPFSVAGLRFAPRSVRTATIHAGDKLPLVFQLELPVASRPATLHLHYVVGVVAALGQTPMESDEDVSTDNADAAGNVLTGHTLATATLQPGTYRVVVHVTGAAGTASASSTLTLHLVPLDAPVGVWTAYGAEPPTPTADDDIKRGLASAALGKWDEAVHWYAGSLREFPDDPRSVRQLAAALAHLNRTRELAVLSSQPLLAKHAEPETALLVAGALDSMGATAQAMKLLEVQVALQPPSAALLNALAGFYDHSGDGARAKQYRQRALAALKTP